MQNPRILLVEDDPISAMLATKMLKEIDAVVTVAPTGAQAIAYFEGPEDVPHEFDLILMDLYLPDMSGLATWEIIRKTLHFCDHRIPAIALTSNALMEPKADFLRTTGFKNYIAKPVQRETFVKTLQQHLPKAAPKLPWY